MFKKLFKFTIFVLLLFFLVKLGLSFYSPSPILNFENQPKTLLLRDNGLEFKLKTTGKTVDNFLTEQKITLAEHDQITPNRNSSLLTNSTVEIKRAIKINIAVDGKNIKNHTLTNNLDLVLQENNITLGRLDKTIPDKYGLLENDMEIIVTRINIEEKIIPEKIPFKTTTKTASKLGWREKKTEQAGENGIIEVKYKITYKDGKETSRVILEKNITKEPTTEIITQGTYMKLGSAAKGQGTWYAYKGGLFAASTTIPKGNYAKVTNTANGKSIIVQINDYGPQGKGRIIDLDKVAFQKIASLGAGVIGVRVEEVLN
ncbi:MAG: G5 domain-containing protein [Candidatus Moraniibacteriota bacterium]